MRIQSVALTLAFTLLFLAGCSSSREEAAKPKPESGPSALAQYEAGFTPSDYDSALAAPAGKGKPEDVPAGTGTADSASSAEPEFIQGFRVQVLATTSIDDVNSWKAQAEEAFPNESFYVEFDPPAYKLRAGNFQNRFDADRFARALAAKGFTDAWVVPERVYKNPPLPTHPAPAQPDSIR